MSVGITSFFWLGVVAAWITIMGKEKIPFFMYFLIVGFAIVVVIISATFLTIIAQLSEGCSDMTRRWKLAAWFLCVNKRNEMAIRKNILVFRLKTKSLQPIRITYKPFFHINRRFTMDTLMNAIDLLIQF